MSLKVFKVTATARRWEHLFRMRKPETVRKNKLLSRRSERRRVRRELQSGSDSE